MATVRGHGPNRGVFPGALDGATIWWVAPNYTVANEIIWPQLKRALKDAWVDKSEVEHYIGLPNGGSVTVKSADKPDSLRGAGLHGVVVDEAAFCQDGLWEQILRPMLTVRQGWAMFITTPNGPNWFYRMFQEAANRDGWQRWQKPTWENPCISDEELESARVESGPREFAQEYLAQFTEEAGAVFPVEYFPESMWFDEWPAETGIRLIACDPSLGKTKLSDYSALVCLAKREDTYYVAADLEKRPPSKIVIDALRLYREFKSEAIGFEVVGFQQLLKDEFDAAVDARRMEVWSLGIPNGNEGSKTRRILRLDPLLDQGRLKFLRGDRGTELLVEQLRGFPLPKYHDDGPDALEMAIRLCEQILTGQVIEHGEGEERVFA